MLIQTILDKNLETLWTFSHHFCSPPFCNVVVASETVKCHLNIAQGKGVFQGFLMRIEGFQRTRRSRDCKFMPLSTSVNAHKYSFFPRTILVWNGLPFPVVHSSSVNLFKASIVLSYRYFISFLFLSALCVLCYSNPQYIQFKVNCICLASCWPAVARLVF